MHAPLPKPVIQTPIRRRVLHRVAAAALIGSFMGCGLAVSGPAWAVGSNVEVTVIERDSRAASPSYQHRGSWYVAGRPGAKYALRITNRTGERVLAVMSVDGVNIVTGQTASFEQSGYVLAPWQSAEITGWRKSPREVAAFVFTALPESYAARTGRPDDVGVIGVAVFKERVAVRPPVQISPPEVVGRTDAPARAAQERERAEGDARAATGSSAAPAAGAVAAPAAPALQERLGTGHGEREQSYSSRTRFERSSTSPVELVSLRYDSQENLLLAGVIPPPMWASPSPNPKPFPRSTSGYVPDPPRW